MRNLVLLLVVSSISTVGSIASAQTANGQGTAASDDSDLQEIVVTAERRSENVQTIPIAITALDGAALQGKGVASLTDLQTASPSVSIGSTGVTNSVYIRGVGIASGLANVSNGVATYVDGLFQSQVVTNNHFYDLADIEVLRGPQGTLVGSNSTGGAIFVNSQNPKLGQVGGYVTVGGGNYGDADAQAAFNLPIGDVLAVRVAGDSVSRSSFYNSTGTAYTTAGELREQSGRLSILLKPGNSQALAKVEYTNRNSGGYAATAIPGTPYAPFAPPDPFTLDYDTPSLLHETSLMVPVELRYELPDGITLRSVFGYQDKHVHDLEDYDFTFNGSVTLPRMAKASGKAAATESAPTLVNGKVRLHRRNRKPLERRARSTPGSPLPPRRLSNASRRKREYLTPDEVDKLLQASGKLGRHGTRDRTLILLAYRHGLRVSELVALRWDQVDLKGGLLHVARLKNGIASTHPIRGPELRALRELQRDYPSSPYLFVSELGGPMTPATVRKLFTRAGEKAKLPFPIHPHMLRHSTGYKLANDGHDTRAIQHYLGHRNITHTVRYTELSPERFKGFWKD